MNAPPRLPGSRRALMLLTLVTLAGGAGCSVNGIVTGKLADALSGSGTVYASDDDPALVESAVPFALKTMEQVLVEQPEHVGLLTALAQNFTSFGYAYVQQDGDEIEDKDVAAARVLHARAKRLYLRARNYAIRGLAVHHKGVEKVLFGADEAARKTFFDGMTKEDVPLLYWTGASWALAVSNAKDDMKLVGDLPAIEAVMARALALDESWDEGALHEFYVSYEGSADPQKEKSAREHLARARQLDGNKKLGVLLSFAESVSVQKQDKAEWQRLLDEVLAFDADSDPPHRLANLVAQRRARWLNGRTSELFAN